MFHYMSLVPSAFRKIADGSKIIELRLNDEKRQRIAEGDTIVFSQIGNGDIAVASVKKLHRFSDFAELYEALPLEKCGYESTEVEAAHHSDMERFYSKEDIAKYGALGIELCGVYSICDVKDRLFRDDVLPLLAPSVYNPTPERLQARAEKYSSDPDVRVYAYKDSEYKGIVVLGLGHNVATILDIAVSPDFRGQGIGNRLVDYVKDKINPEKIIAETDDDAVLFYKKYGFKATPIKTDYDCIRYSCILEVNSKSN